MHGVTEFMRQRAHAADVACEAHHDEGMRPRCSIGECTVLLALVRRVIHPALLQAALADGVGVLLPHGLQPFADHVNGLFEGELDVPFRQRRPHIVIGDICLAERLAPDLEIAMPYRQVLLERV